MAHVQEKFQVLAPPTEVWRKAADFSRWGGWLGLDAMAGKGLGGQFGRVEGEGLGARIGLFNGQELFQILTVTDWIPPERLILTMKDWSVIDATKALSQVMDPRIARHQAAWIAMTATFSLAISAADVVKMTSTVSIDIDVEFTHPFFGPLMNFFGPLDPTRSFLVQMARSFSRKLPLAFDEAQAGK
ncbi:MAG: SRPBCC family protein [Elusimicrobia bacterium]|nr:SRPBCC family protein [Elusimicrobiota bacterium]